MVLHLFRRSGRFQLCRRGHSSPQRVDVLHDHQLRRQPGDGVSQLAIDRHGIRHLQPKYFRFIFFILSLAPSLRLGLKPWHKTSTKAVALKTEMGSFNAQNQKEIIR